MVTRKIAQKMNSSQMQMVQHMPLASFNSHIEDLDLRRSSIRIFARPHLQYCEAAVWALNMPNCYQVDIFSKLQFQ